MIQIKELTKKYQSKQGEVVALERVDIQVEKGEIFGIIGPSGAGKSTLIRTLNLLEKPSSGQIILNGEELTIQRGKKLRLQRQKIGMIFQHFNLLHSRTVAENISFPLEIAGITGQERGKRVDRLMELVGLSDRADYYPAQLSGGQKQRVGIARALANEPELLLSDEATSSLDPESTASILQLLSRIREEMDLTILLITHEMGVVKSICDRVAVMEKGRIVERGRVIDIFSAPQHALTRKFIKGVIDFNLPEELQPGADRGQSIDHNGIIRVSFIGQSTHKPLISSLVRTFDLDANILYGKIDDIQGTPFGTLLLKLEGEDEKIEEGIKYMKERGLRVEVLADAGFAGDNGEI